MPDHAIPLNSPEGHLVEATMDAGEKTTYLLAREEMSAGQASYRPSFAELYAFATGGATSGDVPRALATDFALAQDFQRLLENRATICFPQAAAASSGDMEQRQVAGAKIFLRPSRADDDQVYLIITLDDAAAAPQTMIALRVDQSPERAALPPFRNGKAQLLLDKSSALVHAFLDVNAEIYLT